jgi:hypothetical protein
MHGCASSNSFGDYVNILIGKFHRNRTLRNNIEKAYYIKMLVGKCLRTRRSLATEVMLVDGTGIFKCKTPWS